MSREAREGKYGYGLSFRQAPAHSMESSGPKGLVREPVSKVLILQARGPVQSPEPTLKKKKKDGGTMIVSSFWGDRNRQIFGNPGACRSAVLVCLACSGLGRDSLKINK